jgi:hypothetical protein
MGHSIVDCFFWVPPRHQWEAVSSKMNENPLGGGPSEGAKKSGGDGWTTSSLKALHETETTKISDDLSNSNTWFSM